MQAAVRQCYQLEFHTLGRPEPVYMSAIDMLMARAPRCLSQTGLTQETLVGPIRFHTVHKTPDVHPRWQGCHVVLLVNGL